MTTIKSLSFPRSSRAALTLAGCADKILSDDRIRDNTALALNVPAASIVISDRRYDGFDGRRTTPPGPLAWTYRCRHRWEATSATAA